MAINYDEATGGYTEESTTLKPNSNGTINVDEASYVASVNDIHKGTSIVNSANDTSALAETIDNSTTIYVTGTGAYTPNVNLIDEGKIVFGKKDAAFDGTYAGTIDGQASNLATVQVLNGSLTLESGATIDLIGNFDKDRGFILGTVDAAEDDGTMTAVVTVKEGATLNARNYFWIGSANGSYETPEEQSERFKLIIDGGKVDATSNAFTLRNTGAMEILNGGSFSAHDGSVRNYISVTGEGSYLEYGGNVYGEAPSGAEGAPTYGTAYITVSDGATANFTNLSIGGEGASRENRRGSVTLSNATATAKTILLSLANEDEEIRAELSVENSSLTAETITSYGAFNVSGTSTLNIDTLNIGTQEPQDDPMLLLDNAVTLLDGAVLTDSNVGGIVSTEGDVTIAGATTLGQLVLEGSRGDERTIVIDENANVTLNDQKNTNFGVLDVGIGLQKPSVTTQDPNPRQYYGQVLVKGNLSVENYNADTGEGRAGAIYIRPYAELVVTGTLNVKGEVHNRGSLVVDGGTMNMSVWATPKLLGYTTGDSMTVTNKGTMTVSGASAVTFGEASASLQHMEVVAQYEDGMFATISAGGKFEADTLAFANDDDVTLTVTGEGSLFKLYSADGRTVTDGYTYVQNEGKIIIADNAVFDVSELVNTNFVNTGTIDISSATATFATLTNDGTVNFKGGTEFSNTLTGSGTVVYTGEGNRITGGSVSNTKFIVGLENPDAVPTSLEISGGAAVEVTGGGNCGRFAPESDVVITGDGTTFTVYANLTMDESATLAISDGATVNIGYLATGGKTDVTGATLNLTGSVPGKPASAGASAIGGLDDATVFNVSDGGVVNAQAGLVIGHRETKDAEVNVNAGGELNVSGGALYVSGLVGNYTTKGNGVLNIDGGKVTASNGGDFGLYVGDDWGGASGVLNVTNGGSLTAGFSVQFYATSVVTVDGGEITVNQLYQSEGGKLSIVNGGSVTLTNSYFGMGGEITVGGDDSGAVSTFESAALVGAEAASLGGDYGEHEGETVLNILENGEAIFGSGLKVGHRADASVSKDATVNVEEGGRMEVAKTLQIGSVGDAEAVGVVNVTGGELDASTADVGLNSKSSLNITNGSFSAQSVTNNGAINVTGEAVVDAEFAATKTGAFTITDATLGQGTNIQFGAMNVDELLPAVTLKGTVTVTDGAYLNTGREGNLTMGFGTGDSGTLNITDGAQVSLGGALYFGSEEALADDGMFYLNISGEGSRLQSDGYNGEFYITGDAVVTVSNGGTIANNARVRSGATYIFGSVDDTVAANVSFRSMELVEQANVTIQSGAVADLGILVFGDQYMEYNGSFTLAADGQLKLNSYSASSGKAEIAVSGMDDDTFSGVWKLIDNTGSNTLDYSAMISNWDEISGSVAVVENDLYRVNVDMTTLKVNSTWSGSEIGTEVEEGFYYGFNAFDGINTAVVGIADDTTTISIAAGDYAGSADAEFTQGMAIASDGAIFDNMWSFGVNSDTAAEFNPETAEKFTVSGELTVGQFYAEKNANVYVVIDGDLTTVGSFGAKLATQLDINGSVTVTPPENGAAQVMVYGTMNVTGTLDSTSGPMAAVMLIGNDRYDTEYGKGGVLNVTGDNASVTLRGNTDSDMPVLISGLSSLNLSDGATFTHENGSIENKGTINVASSTLTVGVALENSGTVNVSGTSTVAAEIDGALDLLNGADVTFAGGADDLLVASGAKVTLRGELSGNEVVYEKGYKYNDNDARGITVNIASGEGTTFQSYAWYASNGSTYNVKSGSSAQITYANINATGTINVEKDATLTTVMESSNIVGTMNVDGTVNSVITVYAGYTGDAYSDGAQAGLVNITGTANSSIVTIGTAVRDDDKYNAAAAEGANTTASIVVNGGTFNATGQEGELTSKLFVGSTDYAGTLSAVNGTINVGARSAAGTGYMRFLIGENGTLNLDNSTMTVYNLGGTNNSGEGVFQNSGAINMDVDSQIITATVLANSGTITVDMTDATEFNVYKLIDYTGTGTVTDYGKVELDGKNDYGYVASVLNNDLYLVRKDGATEYYVNSEWSSSNLYDEVTFIDGTKAYYGLNAFDTVDHALTATSYENGIWLNVTGDIGAITVVGTNVTEVNVSAKPADLTGDTVIDADAIVVNLVEINNTDADWQVYYPLASGSNAQVYGNITTNFLSTTFTWGEKTADPNFIGGAYAGSTATVYGNTTVNLGAADAADDALMLDTSFLIGAGAGTVNGNSSVNINSGTIQANAIVGGGAWRGQVKGDSSVTISGGQITVNSTEDSPGRAIIGGSYGNVSYDPDAPGDPAATAGKSSVTITGDAVVSGKVVGGSDISAVTNSSVTISGQAQVTGNVYGGGNRGGEVKETATVKLVDTATVDGNVYGGGFGTETAKSTVQGSTRVEVSGGTVTGNVYGGGENSSVGNTSVVVDGADVEAGIYGGSLNGDAGDTTVTISNFTRLQPVPGTQSDKIQIVGGGMAEAGKSSTTASTNVTVTDSRIYGDVVAGSSATGTGATAISGKSVVNVSNLEINGYSEGSNIWTGRVFGAGRAQYGGSVVTESTDVTIENMSGYTYDSEGNIIDGSNKGARVYGAGQAYASMSRVEVGETKLRISGDATNISEIYGGGIVSGTEVQEKAAFQIVGKTDVEITGGTVTDVIAGGNNTNWFGRTVIGVDAGDGTYQAAEGEYGIRLVIGGSTKANEGVLVTGGSYVDFAYEYQHIVDGVDTYGRTAEIYGNTYMELTGDSVISTDVFGGSFAYYEQVDFSADVSKLSAPSATQYGDVTVVVSGNTAIAGSVYGGGAVLTNTDQVKTTSVTNGDVSVLISGGAVGGNVYAGGYYADVNGNASVTLSGGTVGGDIYGGSEGSGTVAGSSTLNVGATDAARYTTTLNNVYDFDVANITNAAVTVEGVFSATQISIADSTLTLNSGFDAATTTVSIEVGAYNAENAALVLGSAVGTAPAISISAGSNALTEARYLVATGFDDTTAFSLDESLAGEYILRAVDGNIYLYNADAPYFTTELSVTQAEGASVDGYYSFTANFEAAGLLTGYTLKLYDSATATTPVDEVTLDADVIGQEFTLENTTQSFWISVTANGENGLSTDSPTSGRLEVVVKDYDSPVIQSVSSNVASDAITLTCEATDNFGVTGYEFILDGQSLGVQTGSEIALDLSTLTAGTHSYTVNVYDAAGNLATSAEQSFDFTPEPGPTEPANFLYSSQVRMDNGETVSVYATYSDAAAALEYRIGDSGEWLTYDATTGVNVSSSTTVYFREQGITDPVETAVDVTVVPADVELNAEVILLAPTTDTTYEVIYNFADGGSKAVELSGNSVEHYALPENTTVTIVEKDASGEVVNTIVEETPAASTTAEIPDKVVAVDDGHANLFFAMPVGQWGTGIAAQHLGDGTWGGTLEIVSLTGKNRFSTVFTGSDDATTLFLTDDANGDVFFLDDIYTANGSDARIRKMSEIQAGAGDDIVDLTSARFAYEEHASKQLTVRGGDGNDILWGNAGHNIMFGDDGNDRIYGGSDNDVLIGGTGNDTMLGGGGDDIFCYGSSFDWGSDTITQLSGGTVTLYLDGIDRNDCSISGSTLTWNDGTHTGSITLNGVSWDSVKFYCAANGDGDLTKQSDYEELKNKGAFAAISSH